MVRGFESSPDILRTRTADMPPAVLRYAENLHQQRLDILVELGFTTFEGLHSAIRTDSTRFQGHVMRKKITQLRDLSQSIREILLNPKEYIPPFEQQFNKLQAEFQELLGRDFLLGIDAVETAFRRDDEPFLRISEEERWRAMEALVEKCTAPDVVGFLERLREDKDEAAEWMLVYRTGARIDERDPVSLLSLQEAFGTDKELNGARPFYQPGGGPPWWYSHDKAEGEDDAWAARLMTAGWMFVTRALVGDTIAKTIDEQTEVLTRLAEELGLVFDERHARRRTPVEVVYDTLLVYYARNIRLMNKEYDCTSQKGSSRDFRSSGDFIGVGQFDTGHISIIPQAGDQSYEMDGACLSR